MTDSECSSSQGAFFGRLYTLPKVSLPLVLLRFSGRDYHTMYKLISHQVRVSYFTSGIGGATVNNRLLYDPAQATDSWRGRYLWGQHCMEHEAQLRGKRHRLQERGLGMSPALHLISLIVSINLLHFVST